MTNQTTVTVKHEERGGYHVFTSDQVKGLLVGGNDLRAVYEDIAESIQYLMKANHNISCTVTPEKTVEEFIAGVDDAETSIAAVRPFHLVHAAA